MQKCFIRYIKHESAARVFYTGQSTDYECFKWLKNDPFDEFIGEEILKINVVLAEKMKAKVYVN
jgi:hypothetical protein